MMQAVEQNWHKAPAQRPPAYGLMSNALMEGESIVHVARISYAIYWKTLAMLLVAIASLALSATLFFYFLAVSTGLFLFAYGAQKYLLLGASDQRIICRSGVVYLDSISIRYAALESVEVVISPLGALLGYGSVIISGRGQRRLIIPYIADALEFRDAVVALMTPPASQETTILPLAA